MLEQFKNQHEQLLMEIAATLETSNLSAQRDRTALYNTISGLVSVLDADMQEEIPYATALEYFKAYDHANELLGRSGTSFNSDGTFSSNTMRQVHVEALEELITDTMLDLRAAYRTFEQNAVGSIDTAIQQVQAELISSQVTGNRNQLKRNVMKAFREQGMTAFVTSDNKMLPLDFYASTVVNTKMAQANVNGHIQRYEDAENDLVKVQARPGTCEHCAAHDGMVYSLSGNHPDYPKYPDNLIPLHPHCACTLLPVVEDFLTPSEKKAIDERVAKGVDFDPRTEAEKALYARDQRINRRNNAEKKLYMKMQQELGADAPASLSAFRRMKRADTSTYQDLYSRYLSAKHTGKAMDIVEAATPKAFDLIEFETQEQIEDPERIRSVVNRAKILLKDYEAATGVNPVESKQARTLRDAKNPYDDEHAKLTRYMMQQTGYDGLPKRMSADEKGFEIYRGVSNNDALNATGADMVERFKSGPVDISGGKSSASGRGMYFDQAIQGAQSYADDNEGGAIITAYILEDTKLMNKKVLSQQLDFYRENEHLFTDEEKAIHDLISGSNFMMDKNYEMYAMLHGYDGMDIGDGWYVMFNRSKLGVKD